MPRRILTLDTLSQANRARSFVDSALKAGGYQVEFKPVTRSTEQNAKMWAMLADIQRALPEWNGTPMSQERWKGTFLDALGLEVEYVPKLEGGGFVPVGHRSSQLSKAQFSDLFELMNAFAARQGIEFKDQAATLLTQDEKQ